MKEGEIFGLLGPNGGGKSTLFRILSTMMVPTEGRAAIAGDDVVRDPAAVRRHIGVVFQTQSLDKALDRGGEPARQGHLHGLSGAELRDRMERAMERLGLTDRAQRPGGNALRAACGGAWKSPKRCCTGPQVLLMDEASTGLDPAARRDLSGHIEESARAAKASPSC